jgi:hypothetical protein
VVNVSGCHGKLGGGEQWGRTRREEACFANHRSIVSRWRGARGAGELIIER